jgi:proteic killer suppression protein
MAIQSFKSKPLQNLFQRGFDKAIPSELRKKLDAMLQRLDSAETTNDLKIAKFHRLKGDRGDTHAWHVTANWRLTFRFEHGDAFDVDLEDYH